MSIVTDFNIREASIDDLDGIAKVDNEAGGLYPNIERKAKELITAENGYFLVATFENQVVGYAGGSIKDTEFGENDPVGYVSHIALRSDFARKGMGKMLGDKLIDAMSERCEKFRTLLSFNRIDLQAYFNQIGFSKTDMMVYEYRMGK